MELYRNSEPEASRVSRVADWLKAPLSAGVIVNGFAGLGLSVLHASSSRGSWETILAVSAFVIVAIAQILYERSR